MNEDAIKRAMGSMAYYHEKSKYFSDILWTLTNYSMASREVYIVPEWSPKMERPKFKMEFATVYHPKDMVIDGGYPIIRQPVRVADERSFKYCWDQLMPVLKASEHPHHYIGRYNNARPTTNMKIRNFLKKVPKFQYRVEMWTYIMEHFDTPCNNTLNMV